MTNLANDRIFKCKKCGVEIEWSVSTQGDVKQYCDICIVEAERVNKLNKRLLEAKFEPKHKDYLKLKLFDYKIEKYKDVKHTDNIFIQGSAGRGKSLYACHRLYSQIKSGMSGRIYIAPRLMDDFRAGANNGGDIRLLDEILRLDALVLDDLGVGRHNIYALEYYYMLIDGWALKNKGGLTIVSNVPLSAISTHLDDRISSRITDLCGMPFVDNGRDFRLKGAV